MNKNFLATFLVTGLIMGLLLTWQFATRIPVEGDFPGDEVQARDDLLKSFLDEQAYLQSRIVSLRKQIEDSQSSLEIQSETVNLALLESLKQEIGLTEVSGEGLEIVLNDSPLAEREGSIVSDKQLVQASDIRDVVNILNAASSDAVAINNQRVIATSPIASVGTTILVNNAHSAPPFTISAVGDSEIMLQRLLNKDLLPTIYEKLQNGDIVFEIYKRNRIVIPIYNGDFKSTYINLVEE